MGTADRGFLIAPVGFLGDTRVMEKLHASHDRFLINTLIARLQGEGIEHLVKDESASSLGEVPPIVSRQHIWIIEPSELERARGILKELEAKPSMSEVEAWTCGGCGEELEPQFSACWSCGSERA